MAEIIPLRPGARAARLAPPPPSEGAQILFFLGVRYCRIEELEESLDPVEKPRGEDDGGKKRRRRARA
jgi:hypothetical protein